MANRLLIAAAAAALILIPIPVRAGNSLAYDALRETGDAPPKGSCSGILRHVTDGYFLSVGKEGICLFNDYDIVLDACKIGEKCKIWGSIELCKDSMECVAVTRIRFAHSKAGR